MPKNTLFKRQNYTSKNYSFYLCEHVIFQNASEIIPFNLFSARCINTQKKQEQLLQPQS